jgi:hypothetical protein
LFIDFLFKKRYGMYLARDIDSPIFGALSAKQA